MRRVRFMPRPQIKREKAELTFQNSTYFKDHKSGLAMAVAKNAVEDVVVDIDLGTCNQVTIFHAHQFCGTQSKLIVFRRRITDTIARSGGEGHNEPSGKDPELLFFGKLTQIGAAKCPIGWPGDAEPRLPIGQGETDEIYVGGFLKIRPVSLFVVDLID